MVHQMKPEVVHSYSFYTNFAAYWATIGTKIISIGSVRSNFVLDKNKCGVVMGRVNARWPRSIIFNSFASVQNAKGSNSLFVPSNMMVVRNGLDLERFRPTPVPKTGRACIVAVGSLLPVKRWDRLLKAASELKTQGFEFVIEIAGIGPLKYELEREAIELGLNGDVSFLGHTKDIAELLSKAAFLVHTSDVEGCPNAVMEAMACGRAVVATDAGEIPFLIEDGKTGFIVRRGDEGTLVDRIAKLLSDSERCSKMGIAGREKAERELGVDRLLVETFAAYEAAGWKTA
jgi:glycosyltransferase involved in cell wall biosynthesis